MPATSEASFRPFRAASSTILATWKHAVSVPPVSGRQAGDPASRYGGTGEADPIDARVGDEKLADIAMRHQDAQNAFGKARLAEEFAAIRAVEGGSGASFRITVRPASRAGKSFASAT